MLHFFPSEGKGAGKGCFLGYHSDICVGLASEDLVVLHDGKRKKEWSSPSVSQQKKARCCGEFVANVYRPEYALKVNSFVSDRSADLFQGGLGGGNCVSGIPTSRILPK